ncbi:hypothetical protein [Granulicella arctica]|uniref:hypothetical protein n=1 Tax=Granulicella arctica TaxID=940613 RepID=UPI0021DF954E|nr:hypothetical protein [Granulicella arctica]
MKGTIFAAALLVTQVAFASNGLDKLGTSAASFQLQDETTTPTGILQAGGYSIRISDHLADRVVIEVQSKEGGVSQKFLGVPAKNISNSSPAGPVVVAGSEGKPALRGFAFAKNSVIEFVYPKNDAVALAKASGSTVLAIDPASEGMTSAEGLSAEDRRIVTLWMLTPTPVGSNDSQAAIKAAKYQAPSDSGRLAEVKPAVLARLPKTASDYPLLCVFGFCAFGAAMLMTFVRVRSAVS